MNTATGRHCVLAVLALVVGCSRSVPPPARAGASGEAAIVVFSRPAMTVTVKGRGGPRNGAGLVWDVTLRNNSQSVLTLRYIGLEGMTWSVTLSSDRHREEGALRVLAPEKLCDAVQWQEAEVALAPGDSTHWVFDVRRAIVGRVGPAPPCLVGLSFTMNIGDSGIPPAEGNIWDCRADIAFDSEEIRIDHQEGIAWKAERVDHDARRRRWP